MFTGLTCRIFLQAIMAFIHQILGFVEDIDHHDAPSNPVRMSALHDWPEGTMPNTFHQALSLPRLIYRKTGFLWAMLRVSVLFLLISATWTGTLAADLAQPEGAMNATNAINATTPENMSQGALTHAREPFMGGGPFERGGMDGPQNNSVKDYAQINNNSIINNESIQATMLKLPLSFIENKGQSSEDVKFMVKTAGQTVFFTPSEVVFTLSSGNNSSVVRMAFEDSSPGEITGEQPLPGRANFFIGNDSSRWSTEVPTYGAIRYKNFYPGVDLIFKGTEAQLKHELVLSQGADPASIVLSYSGQDNLSLAEDGSVLIRTAIGNITDSAPFCYQEIDGTRVTIEGRYQMIDDHRIGFDIDSYNKSYPLVIDPILKYSTYLGGSSSDGGQSIAVDSSGNVYVTGYTSSTDFPIQNPGTYAGGQDAFVTKLSPGGNTLVYSTYLSGSNYEYGSGIAVDGSGNAYVTGYTFSTDFPIQNPYQDARAGGPYVFVTKLSPGGNTLVYSTYLGGSSANYGFGIAVDGSGNAYVIGDTTSTNFPIQNPYQSTLAGNYDIFVTKLSPAGNTLVYSTYLGGSVEDHGDSIAVDGSGNAYLTGYTRSTDFPIQNPYQSTKAGYTNAFVTKLNPGGDTLAYSTYLGGSDYDIAECIAVDHSGNAYITGGTESTDFPIKNPYQSTKAGGYYDISDAFVTKLNPEGDTLVYSTYLGGSGGDHASGIAVDGNGSAYVTGHTDSANFPTKNPYQGTNTGGSDVFITKLSSGGNTLVYSTYLGGSSSDEAYGIAVDCNYNAYVTGMTDSANFPTENPYQSAFAGASDAFVAVLSQSWPSQTDYVLLPPGAQIADAYHVAVIGDSVAWGNGLKRENTYYYLVADWLQKVLNRTVEVKVYAHSGATIVGQTCENIHPALSSGCPTLMDQANNVQNAADLDLILVSGGGNDVGVMKILDYYTPAHEITTLSKDIEGYMENLLKSLLIKCPNAKIIVTNYYPLIGNDISADQKLLLWLYYALGNQEQPPDLIDRIRQNSDLFHAVSTTSLTNAVNHANNGANRISLASTNFAPNNCYSASETWLWKMVIPNINPFYLKTDDEMFECRNLLCDPSDPYNISRINAIGHPNRDGAKEYARAIEAVITGDKPPNTPDTPIGVGVGYALSPYSYSTSANDPDGDQVKYTFDWDDGTTSVTSLVNSSTVASASHTWNNTGIYQVKAKATDSNGLDSEWSNTISVSIVNRPPNAPDTPIGVGVGFALAPYSYATSSIDPDGDQVKYTFDWGDGTTSVTGLVNSGTVASASHTWAKAGTYQVKANATDSKGATSGYSSILTVTINPNKSPNAPSKPLGSAKCVAGSSYSYSTSATDPDKDKVKYTFDWGDGTKSETGLVTSGIKSSAMHAWSVAGTYLVKANATDSKGAVSGYSSSLTIIVNPNKPPTAPSKPLGSATCVAGSLYIYSTSAKDPDGDTVKYTFDWGDGTKSETGLVKSGIKSSATHAWSTPGTYLVRTNATDFKGGVSGYSSILTVTVNPNKSPNAPSKPSGSAKGYASVAYSYTTSATDPDKDQVKYTFDWGDGTKKDSNLVNSGTKSSSTHAWSAAGTYQVKANATDSKGAVSGYSVYLSVTISPNGVPGTPSVPSGATLGKIKKAYRFTTSATDPDGDKLKYTFDWGDGKTSVTSLVNSGTNASSSHAWSSAGTYQVKVMATDSKGATSISQSNPLTVMITLS
jgi:lysophospholipase L1-like esterase